MDPDPSNAAPNASDDPATVPRDHAIVPVSPRRPLDMYEGRSRVRRQRPAPYRDRPGGNGNGLWIALGVGAALGAVGAGYLARRNRQEELERRPPDSAPRRTLRNPPKRDDGRAVTGRTVTIAKPRSEVYDFWHDHANLSRVIENVQSVTKEPDGTYRWSIATLGTRTIEMRTRNTVERENEEIRWVSTDDSSIDTEGQITFRDAPADRGTEVTLTMLYRLPGGELGRLAATLLQRSPGIQARRAAKRMRMLMETGEIATAANRRTAA